MVMTSAGADFEVAIIGGGPGGSTTAGYLAKAGIPCVVLERALFPRPHIGESLVPSTTPVFRDLGFIDVMEREKFPRKYGAVWTANAQAPTYHHDWDELPASDFTDIRFEEREQKGVDRRYTYHVDRGKFDLLYLQHAESLGAKVYEGVNVRRIDLDAEPFPRVYFNMGPREMFITAKMVVDATGRDTLLGNQLRIKVKDPVFNQFAFHAWFEGYDRRDAKQPDKTDYIFIHFLPMTNSWIWQIPITESITSIGIVTQRQHFPKTREARETWFWDCIKSRPDVHERLQKAERIRPFKEEGDYSYAMQQVCGDRWALVGDAGRFVDPIFSSGVSIAMNGARFLTTDICAAAEKGDYSKKSFENFERTLRWGTRNWYDFITMYYRLNVLFTLFIQDPRYRLDVLKLLQGDVWDEETPEVLRNMKEIVTSVEKNPKHIWHKLLGDLTCTAFKPSF
jgi:FADH2 O2-dependent halogenase